MRAFTCYAVQLVKCALPYILLPNITKQMSIYTTLTAYLLPLSVKKCIPKLSMENVVKIKVTNLTMAEAVKCNSSSMLKT